MSNTIKPRLIRSLFLSITISAFFIAYAASLSAQQSPTWIPQPQVTEHPDGPSVTFSPEEEAAILSGMMTLDADLTSRSIFDYTIAYWIAEGETEAETDPLFSTEAVAAETGAQVFSDFEAFMEADAETPFEIIIVHPSFYEQMDTLVDKEWAVDAFRKGVLFVGLTVTIPQLGEIVQSECIPDFTYRELPEGWRIITVLGYHIQANDPAVYDTLKQRLLDDCETQILDGVTQTEAQFLTDHKVTMTAAGAKELPRLLIANTYYAGLPNRSAERAGNK